MKQSETPNRDVCIPRSLLDQIKHHAEESYPNECNGLIVGNAGTMVVANVCRAANVHEEGTRHRYFIDPRELLRIEKEARAAGLDVIGVYHSHPDNPAVPSQYDRTHAWPSYVYVIVAVLAGKAGDVKAWTLREDGSGFDEVKVGVVR